MGTGHITCSAFFSWECEGSWVHLKLITQEPPNKAERCELVCFKTFSCKHVYFHHGFTSPWFVVTSSDVRDWGGDMVRTASIGINFVPGTLHSSILYFLTFPNDADKFKSISPIPRMINMRTNEGAVHSKSYRRSLTWSKIRMRYLLIIKWLLLDHFQCISYMYSKLIMVKKYILSFSQ